MILVASQEAGEGPQEEADFLALVTRFGKLLLLTVVAWVSPLFAQEAAVGGASGTQNAQGEGLFLNLVNELRYDDNVLRLQDNPLGSRVWYLNAQANYGLQRGGTQLQLSHTLEHNRYLDSPADTHTNQLSRILVEQALNSSNKVSLLASRARGFEQRGLGISEGPNALLAVAPTPLNEDGVTVNYQLGRELARMRLIATLGHSSTDRNSALIVNDSRDYTIDTRGLQMLYKVGSRTDLVVERQVRDFDYARTSVDAAGDPLSLDSTDTRTVVGVNLAASAKTVARIRVGRQTRDFGWREVVWEDETGAGAEGSQAVTGRAAGIEANTDNSDLYWEIAAVWSPRTYSRFEINSQTSTRESVLVGTFVRRKDLAFRWVHDWNSRLRTQLDISVGEDVYLGSNRADRRKGWGLKLEHAYSRALHVGYGYTGQQLTSSFEQSGFDRSLHYLFFNYRREPDDP